MYSKVLEIEWNHEKAASNIRKHGVSFEEAYSSLLDTDALVLEDLDSEGENRWILIGMSNRVRLLTVVYTLRGDDSIRLISARKSSRKEGDYHAQRI